MSVNFNETPVKTWYWLNINDSVEQLQNANTLSKKEIKTSVKESSFNNYEIKTGLGENYVSFIKNSKSETKSYIFEYNETLIIRYITNDVSCDYLNLDIRDDANAKVFMIFDSNKKQGVECHITTKVHLGNNSTLKLYQLSRLPNESKLFTDIGAVCEEKAQLENKLLYIGSNKTYAGMRVDLVGDYSSIKCDSVYFGVNNKLYDYNFIVNQIGKKTNCEIFVNGCLDDNATKRFRGTIDFKTGSSGSVGLERENVLLLGENVTNSTLPIILCSEEDVQGNHGASIGRIDDNVLFYLKSRGLDEEQIKTLMTVSMIESRIKDIEDTRLRNEMMRFFNSLI